MCIKEDDGSRCKLNLRRQGERKDRLQSACEEQREYKGVIASILFFSLRLRETQVSPKLPSQFGLFHHNISANSATCNDHAVDVPTPRGEDLHSLLTRTKTLTNVSPLNGYMSVSASSFLENFSTKLCKNSTFSSVPFNLLHTFYLGSICCSV